jgi:hypothetical protein
VVLRHLGCVKVRSRYLTDTDGIIHMTARSCPFSAKHPITFTSFLSPGLCTPATWSSSRVEPQAGPGGHRGSVFTSTPPAVCRRNLVESLNSRGVAKPVPALFLPSMLPSRLTTRNWTSPSMIRLEMWKWACIQCAMQPDACMPVVLRN